MEYSNITKDIKNQQDIKLINQFSDMNQCINNLFHNISLNKSSINERITVTSDLNPLNHPAKQYLNSIDNDMNLIRNVIQNFPQNKKSKKYYSTIETQTKNIQIFDALNEERFCHFIQGINKFSHLKLKYFPNQKFTLEAKQKKYDIKIKNNFDIFIEASYASIPKSKVSLKEENRENFSFASPRKIFEERKESIENESNFDVVNMEEDKCEKKTSKNKKLKENNVYTSAILHHDKYPEFTKPTLQIRNIQTNISNKSLFAENFQTQELNEISAPLNILRNEYKESFLKDTKENILSPIFSPNKYIISEERAISFSVHSPIMKTKKEHNFSKMNKFKDKEKNKTNNSGSYNIGVINKETNKKKKMVNFFDYERRDLKLFEMSVS